MKQLEAIKLRTAAAIWQSAVKSRRRLAGLLVRVVPLIVGGQSRSWVKAVHVFADLAIRLRRKQGDRGLALFLKANTLVLMRVLSGSKLEQTRLAGCAVSVTRKGIPRWIPIQHRNRLLGGDKAVIRFYLGLLSLYRALDFRGKLDLSTVTDPGVSLRPALMNSLRFFFREEFFEWASVYGVKKVRKERDTPYEGWGNPAHSGGALVLPDLAPIRKLVFSSGPNSSLSKTLSVGNLWIDALAIISRPHILSVFECLNILTGHSELGWMPWWKDATRTIDEWNRLVSGKSRSNPIHELSTREVPPSGSKTVGRPQFDIGKLGVVEEPGKSRVIAMVDSWTQQYLYPLHRIIFDRVLRKIPQDGTFAQAKPIEDLLQRAKERGQEGIWSYDLSAATDRLPVKVQEALLGAFATDGYAGLWSELLVNRDYKAPRKWGTTFGAQATYVRYAVGQPMGAYSSWAMLALTHHALIQFAAREAGFRAWFTEYAILGDDIVIGDGNVASKYVSLMTELGVKIGFHKSIISNNCSAEFAKQFYYRGERVTPLSLLGIAVGWLGVSFVPEVISACESRPGVGEVSLYQIARYLGVGYKSASAAAARLLLGLPRNLRSALILLLRPGAPRGLSSLMEWYKTQAAMSGSLATKGDSDGLWELSWAAVVDGRLAPVLKRFRKVVNGFTLPEQCLGHKNTGPFRQWFKALVADPILGQATRAVDRAGDALREARKARDRSGLEKALTLLEQIECDLASIPVEVKATLRLQDEDPGVRKVLLPLSVKRWIAAGKFIERKRPGRFRVRKLGSVRVDLGGRLSRV